MIVIAVVMMVVFALAYCGLGSYSQPITSIYGYEQMRRHPSVPEPVVTFKRPDLDLCMACAIFVGAPIGAGIVWGLPFLILLGLGFGIYAVIVRATSAESREQSLKRRFQHEFDRYLRDTAAAFERDQQKIRNAEHQVYVQKLVEDTRRELKALEATNAGLRWRFEREVERDS